MENTQKPKEVRRKRWLRLSKRRSIGKFNRKRFIKGFPIYKNRNNLSIENSTHEFEYFTSVSKSFDRRKINHGEVDSDRKENVQWETLDKLDSTNLGNKSEIKRLFWKNKKLENCEEINCEEMWTFSAKQNDSQSQDAADDCICYEDPEKIFWKTSKIPLPVNMNRSTSKHRNPKMLWRSLKHIQRLYEDNYVDLSEIMNVEFKNVLGNKDLEIVSDSFFGTSERKKPANRKARLSRWAFLRHESDYRQVKSKPTKANPHCKLNVILKRNPKGERMKKPVLKGYEYSSDESCSCSCCSCEKCLEEVTESQSTDKSSQLSERNMAPNSEEDQIAFQSNRSGWGMDLSEKEPLRPPVYNPEDYAISLKKWGKKANNGTQLPLYLSQSTGSIEKISGELSLQNKKQSSLSTKSSSSSIRSGDEKDSKKDKEFTLRLDKKDLKNKENINRGSKNDLNSDFRNPILTLTSQEGEMSLRQFSSITELLGKLKVDLKYSFPSFVQEFVGDPVDGITLLLELLRALQLSQASQQQQKRPPQLHRKALLDEHSCLLCLKHCLRCADATRRLASSPAGLFTLAVCIMSNVTQSRIMALELLTKACEATGGHKTVSEALSTLRLRFGEPVRFRFLVGMLSSSGTVELLSTAMKFINVFVESSPNIQQKVYIQAELEQAGFDAKTLRKILPSNSEGVKSELNKWEKSYFDVENLQNKVVEVNSLHEKVQLLEKRIQILQEEKGVLQSLEQCLKERCSELEEEVSTKANTNPKSKSSSVKQYTNYKSQTNTRNAEKGESTPAEDEGISSSEQELSQDEDYTKGSISYNSNQFEPITNSRVPRTSINCTGDNTNRLSNRIQDNKMLNNCNSKNLKNIRGGKMKETNVDDGNDVTHDERDSNDEDETTIDEVIEELENIVNDAETEVYAKEETVKLNEKLRLSVPTKLKRDIQGEDKSKICPRSSEKEVLEEAEIIPSMLHPQPPRKAKSLIHIYFSERDFDSQDQVKSEFFDEDSDSESSDSLLTAAREKRAAPRNSHKSLDIMDSFNSFSSVDTRTLFIKQEGDYEDSEINAKMSYEERNIDEEEVKRKHLKNKFNYNNMEEVQRESFLPKVPYKDKKLTGQVKKSLQNVYIEDESSKIMTDSLLQNGYSNYFEKPSFQEVQTVGERIFNECPVPNKPQRFIPTPVKRSQTFHISTSDGDKMHKRSEIKPKPKMGVSGLDFQRNSEHKFKNDQIKYQNVEFKKHVEKKPDASDRYSKKGSKDVQKIPEISYGKSPSGLYRRGSFDGYLTGIKVEGVVPQNRKQEHLHSFYIDSSKGVDKSPPKLKSKNLEKMDDGLDSLVDIVIASDEIKKPKLKNDYNLENSRNIGPRTRMSLAESSIFTPPPTGSGLLKVDESPKPPKPAQRTSLTRNNSSSNLLRLPIEVKLAPVRPNPQHQVVYNFGIKSSKSEDSLVTAAKRYPPDGSSNPLDLKSSNYETQTSHDDKSPIYSTPVKQSKIQKFFGNPKFETTKEGEEKINQKYFESNYACTSSLNEKTVSPMPRTLQSLRPSPSQKEKSVGAVSGQTKTPTIYKPVLPKENPSKPNFLLGTYQPRTMKTNIPTKSSSSVFNSINNINKSFLEKRGGGLRKNFSGSSNTSGNENMNNRKSVSITSLEKVTDSLSGLY